jgi:hypothetical protein
MDAAWRLLYAAAAARLLLLLLCLLPVLLQDLQYRRCPSHSHQAHGRCLQLRQQLLKTHSRLHLQPVCPQTLLCGCYCQPIQPRCLAVTAAAAAVVVICPLPFCLTAAGSVCQCLELFLAGAGL